MLPSEESKSNLNNLNEIFTFQTEDHVCLGRRKDSWLPSFHYPSSLVLSVRVKSNKYKPSKPSDERKISSKSVVTLLRRHILFLVS